MGWKSNVSNVFDRQNKSLQLDIRRALVREVKCVTVCHQDSMLCCRQHT